MMQAAGLIQAGAMAGSTMVGTVTTVSGLILDIKKGENLVKTKKADGESAVVNSITPPPVRPA